MPDQPLRVFISYAHESDAPASAQEHTTGSGAFDYSIHPQRVNAG